MSAPAPSMFTPAAKAMAEKLGLKMGRANLDEFAATLEELAKAPTGKRAWRPRITSWTTLSPFSTTTRSKSPATRAT